MTKRSAECSVRGEERMGLYAKKTGAVHGIGITRRLPQGWKEKWRGERGFRKDIRVENRVRPLNKRSEKETAG